MREEEQKEGKKVGGVGKSALLCSAKPTKDRRHAAPQLLFRVLLLLYPDKVKRVTTHGFDIENWKLKVQVPLHQEAGFIVVESSTQAKRRKAPSGQLTVDS